MFCYNIFMSYIDKLSQKELLRQKNTLNLIASENYPSPAVLKLLGSVWNNKYAEGYPGKRYYAGNVYADELEEFVKHKALEVFDRSGEYGVNVQVLSGSPANSMVYLAVLEPGDKVLSLDLKSGGHLSHLNSSGGFLKFFESYNYGLKESNSGYELDIDEYEEKVKKIKPRLVIVGFSSYPKIYEFEKLCNIAHKHGALVLADISHISGLVATGYHPTPFVHNGRGADFITTTTHKTLRGPRSAMLFAKTEYMPAINKTVFPDASGGPHLNQVAAVGQALLEVLGEASYPDKLPFEKYIKAVLNNSKALEEGLSSNGIKITTQTQNHLVLINLTVSEDSLEIQNKLEDLALITNRNSIPFDSKPAWRPSGLRMGMAALTSRGIDTQKSKLLGTLIAKIIKNDIRDEDARREFDLVINELNWWY